MRKGSLALGAVASAAVAVVAIAARRRRPRRSLVYIGTQGEGPGGGIHAAMLDETTGDLAPLGLVASIARPTWVLAHPTRPLLFATSEVGNAGDREGEVASFAIEAGGGLREIARVSSAGGGATHLTLDDAGATLFVANFGGGQVAGIAVSPDGALASARPGPPHRGSGPHRRQKGPHPHGVTIDPSGHHLLAPDMGSDEIYGYRIAGTDLEPLDPPAVRARAGSGPRLLLFGRDGRFAYLLSELSAEIFVYRWHAAEAQLVEIGRVALDEPGIEDGRSAAGFVLSADGRRLYASNRRTDAIHVFRVDRWSGLLREIQRIASGGAKPWCLALSPSGRWLLTADQGADVVVPFMVSRDGRLARRGRPAQVPTPTGLAFARRRG